MVKIETDLGKLIREIRDLFRSKQIKYSTHMFSLVYWEDGYWSITVTDDWHIWMDKKIPMFEDKYITPEMACREFLKYIKKNKIIVSKLQYYDKRRNK